MNLVYFQPTTMIMFYYSSPYVRIIEKMRHFHGFDCKSSKSTKSWLYMYVSLTRRMIILVFLPFYLYFHSHVRVLVVVFFSFSHVFCMLVLSLIATIVLCIQYIRSWYNATMISLMLSGVLSILSWLGCYTGRIFFPFPTETKRCPT